MAAFRRAPPATRCPTECRPLRRRYPTTRSRRSGHTSALPGATGDRRCRRDRPMNCASHLWIDAAMISSESDSGTQQDAAVNEILSSGAKGAVMLAGLATAIVVAIWFAFYLLVFLPRAIAP